MLSVTDTEDVVNVVANAEDVSNIVPAPAPASKQSSLDFMEFSSLRQARFNGLTA